MNRSSLDFAYDRPDAAQLGALEAAICESQPSWALLDMALLDADAVHRRMRRFAWTTFNAYARSGLSAFEEHSAWLVALEPDAHAMVRALLEWTAGSSALSFLYGAADPARLQALAGYLGKAMVEDRKQPLHCRFADTRVLPALLAALQPAQTTRILAAIDDWGWVDREAAYLRWQPSVDAVHADTADCLRLSAAQFRTVRAASDADAIFTLLLEQTPSLVPGEHRGRFHARLSGLLHTADSYRIRDIESRLQFVVLSLSCGDDFHRLPGLADTWAGVLAGDYRLVERMPLWDNELWDQLEANPSRQGNAAQGARLP